MRDSQNVFQLVNFKVNLNCGIVVLSKVGFS